MKTLYRNTFNISRENSEEELIDSIADEFWNWVFKRRGGKGSFFPIENKPSGVSSLKQLTGRDGATLETLKTTNENGDISFGLSFKHPDARQPEIEWISEAGVIRKDKGKCVFSFSLMVAKRDGSYSPVDRDPSCPNVIKQIIKKYNCTSKLRLTANALKVNTEAEAMTLFKFIRNDERTHPILLVSKHEQSNSYLFDYNKIAENLCGLVYVVVAQSQELTLALSKLLPSWHSCFDGAARLYWPGYRPMDDPSKHPLWIGSRIITMNQNRSDVFAQKLLSRVCEVFSYHTSVGFLSWAKIQEFDRKRAIKAAIDSNELTELVKLYEDENVNLTSQVESLRVELDSKTKEAHGLKLQLESYTEAFNARKDGLEDLAAAENQLPVESVDEAMHRASQAFENELIFSLNSKSTKSGSPFQPAPEVLQAFQWIASTYRDSRMGKGAGQDLNIEVQGSMPGWSFTPRQTGAATGPYKEWYQCQHNGTTYQVHQHLKFGSRRCAEDTIRIAFAYCSEMEKVVIGFIGQHQKNSKS
jgi:hypothetical protein